MDATNVNRHVTQVDLALSDRRGDGGRADTVRAVELALDAVEPLVMKLIADPAISAEHAMHVVVMERAGEAGDSARPFNEAIAVERSFGDPSRWQADYREYARAKTRVSWREQASLRTLLAQSPDSLRPGDIRVEGAVCERGWTVGASGAQAWYDHAIACATIALIEAAFADARASGGR